VGRNLFLILLASLPLLAQQADLDRDSLPDELEQLLLQRFRPAFHLSPTDCDVLPSEFQPGATPRPIARNATIYTQASPVSLPGRKGAFIELHYYHLWANDCGRAGHLLDVEHVSALLHAPSLDSPAPGWKALYWYAAAHEDTPCDSSNGARAAALDAEFRGPDVFISHGKHASYLSLDLCNRKGCGGDACNSMAPMPAGQLINIGEASAPLNGALWVRSGPWSFLPKLQSDFTPATLSILDALGAPGAAPVNSSWTSVKAVFLAGNSTIGALETGNHGTSQALNTADTHTENALSTAADHTGDALAKSASKVKRSLLRARKWCGF